MAVEDKKLRKLPKKYLKNGKKIKKINELKF